MTHIEGRAMLQLIAELRVGAPSRAEARAAQQQEDAQYAASLDGLRRQQRDLGDL